ncbi:hypothetical protein U1Q18_002745 [Sarracenia purpurea var. burkii]
MSTPTCKLVDRAIVEFICSVLLLLLLSTPFRRYRHHQLHITLCSSFTFLPKQNTIRTATYRSGTSLFPCWWCCGATGVVA